MSLFSLKTTGGQGLIQPWAWTWVPGADLAGLSTLYDSRGDVTIGANTSIANVTDGPIVAARYHDLILNATLSLTNRCRGCFLFVDGSLTINFGGGISMTGRGAAGNESWGLYDVHVPTGITISSSQITLAALQKYIRDNNLTIFDRWWLDDLARSGLIAYTWTKGAAVDMLTAATCGVPSNEDLINGSNLVGANGTAGTNAPGSGGRGGIYSAGNNIPGGRGTPWGGGTGSGGVYATSVPLLTRGRRPSQFGGSGGDAIASTAGSLQQGGGAGNPSGYRDNAMTTQDTANGTGGILYLIVRGNIVISSGGIVQADGMPGGAGGSYAAGGASGGGLVFIAHNGSYTNSGTVRANGGAAATGNPNGGAGGAGGVVVKTWTDMGWS